MAGAGSRELWIEAPGLGFEAPGLRVAPTDSEEPLLAVAGPDVAGLAAGLVGRFGWVFAGSASAAVDAAPLCKPALAASFCFAVAAVAAVAEVAEVAPVAPAVEAGMPVAASAPVDDVAPIGAEVLCLGVVTELGALAELVESSIGVGVKALCLPVDAASLSPPTGPFLAEAEAEAEAGLGVGTGVEAGVGAGAEAGLGAEAELEARAGLRAGASETPAEVERPSPPSLLPALLPAAVDFAAAGPFCMMRGSGTPGLGGD